MSTKQWQPYTIWGYLQHKTLIVSWNVRQTADISKASKRREKKNKIEMLIIFWTTNEQHQIRNKDWNHLIQIPSFLPKTIYKNC